MELELRCFSNKFTRVLPWAAWMFLTSGTGLTWAQQIPFRLMAQGVLENADIIRAVRSDMECFFLCQANKVCSAFSITQASPFDHQRECRIALGYFSWAPNNNASLFIEYNKTALESHPGYTFQRDGKFYAFYNNSPSPSPHLLSRLRCDLEGGTVAVPYPKLAQDIVSSVAPPGVFFVVGITRLSSSAQGYWVTYDGDSFNDSNSASDSLQKWISGRPSNTGVNDSCVQNVPPAYGWNNLNCANNTRMHDGTVCRKTVGYRKANNGKFYKLRKARAPLVYAAAAGLCEAEGAVLAVPYPMTEFRALEGFSAAYYWTSTAGLLAVAGTDAAQEDTWVMPNGIQFVARNATDMDQPAWNPNKPSGGTSSNCLAIENGALSDVSCTANTVARFLCQKTWP